VAGDGRIVDVELAVEARDRLEVVVVGATDHEQIVAPEVRRRGANSSPRVSRARTSSR
jgi:hypothetical protein